VEFWLYFVIYADGIIFGMHKSKFVDI